jgi:DNA repair protein SbcD/Mre11
VRLIHTSDWHLGRTFHRVGMQDAQAGFLDHLVEVVRDQGVDVVLVAGDVYDRALPSVDTVAMLDDALVRLREAGAQVVLASGNHDSPQRLGFGARVMAVGGVHVRTDPTRCAEPILLSDEHGPVAVYPVPYLEPTLVGGALDLSDGRPLTHQRVLTQVMERIRADLGRQPSGTRSVVAAHAFVVGGQASDSERDINVGGVAAVPTAVFDGIDYVALGHLHGRTTLTDRLRYSGSPVAYSFSEAGQVKGSWLVDLDAQGLAAVAFVAAPVTRELAILRGRIDDLLADPAYAAAEGSYCQVTLTDAHRPRAAMDRLRGRFPHTLVLAFEPEGDATPLRDYSARVRGRADLDVCCDFLAHVRGGSAPTSAERDLLRAALEATRDADRETVTPATAAARDLGVA